MDLSRWTRLEQHLDGLVVLEHGEPRREAIVQAFERAGYRQVHEPPESATVGYRDAATPSLSMRFVWGRNGNQFARSIHIWRADARTMAYSLVLFPPLWLLQVAGALVGILSVGAAALGDPAHRPWIVGLIVAGVFLGLPKLWLDDLRELLRDALEGARAAEATPDASAEPAKARVRVEPVADEKVRVPADDPALAAAARTARDGVMRHEASDPEDLVEELERAARRGDEGD